ncbi:MAG: gluconeogenesis factor YvcK family protein [Cyanobacteriota bacterium]
MINRVSKYMPNVRRGAIWFLPGLKVKRWLFLTFTGVVLIGLGAAILFNLHPIHFSIEFLRAIASKVTSGYSGTLAIVLGIIFFFFGWRKANRSIFEAVLPQNREKVLEALYRKHKLNRGPKIVAIGGGTGLSTILKGLKRVTNNLTAVVTVGDDGGSSGRLREEMGVLPPGDIRNCIAALADEEKLVTELFQYRFSNGEGLEGHSFGNLFLTALCSITGDMVTAVKESSKVLAIRGRVLPSTLEDMKLVAEMEDGRIISGESNIPEATGKIKRLRTDPEKLKALPEVIKAIEEADIIILGPGSLYTSVIPNLLIPEIATTVSMSTARKIYICNVMTQPGETDNYSASDHLKAIIDHANSADIVDTIFINDQLTPEMKQHYAKEDSEPVENDIEVLEKMKVNIVCKRLIQENNNGLVRHSPQRIARYIQHWYRTGGLDLDTLERKLDSQNDDNKETKEIVEKVKVS